MRNSPFVAIVLATSLAIPPLAGANDAAALAESLFTEGRRLGFEEGKWAEACPKFAESHRLRPGGGVVLNLAHCYRQIGKTALAYAHYKEGLSLALRDKNEARAKLATDALAELEPQLSFLTIDVREESAGLEVRLDDQRISRAAWGTKLAVDPGKRTVYAAAPGKVASTTSITIGVAESKHLEIAPLVAEAATSTATPPSSAPDVANGGEPTKRTIGLVVAGVGVVGVGLGTYFGLRALSEKKASESQGCPEKCTAAGSANTVDAARFADVSTASLVVGVASLAVGSWLFFSAKSAPAHASRPATPYVAVDATHAFVGFSGAF
jgi:hypothetical protein